MAIGTPVDRGRAGGTTSATTASFTPTAGSLLIALVSAKSGSLPSEPGISDSLGGSWTKITDVDGPASNPFIVGALHYQVVGGSPAAMTVSATGGATSTIVSVIEITGAGTDFSNIAVNANTAGDPSCTLSAPAGTSAVIGWAQGHLSNVITQVATYTELFDSTPVGATNHRVEFAYDLSSPASTLSWTSTNTNSVGVALEIKEPASGGTGLIKVWNGAWVEKPVKVWNGASWVAKPLKVWNGSAWVLA